MNVYIKNDQYWNIIIEVTAQYNTPRNTLFVWMLQAHNTHTPPTRSAGQCVAVVYNEIQWVAVCCTFMAAGKHTICVDAESP